MDKVVKNNSPSAHHYNPAKSFDRSAGSPRSIQWSIPKGKKEMFVDRELKKKSKIPGVGQYNVEKGLKAITLGARGKVGYYSRR